MNTNLVDLIMNYNADDAIPVSEPERTEGNIMNEPKCKRCQDAGYYHPTSQDPDLTVRCECQPPEPVRVSKYGHQIGNTCKACDCVIDHFGCGCNPPDA